MAVNTRAKSQAVLADYEASLAVLKNKKKPAPVVVKSAPKSFQPKLDDSK